MGEATAQASMDLRAMRLALRLAARGKTGTHPNPMVGAVILRCGRVVGRGYHRRAGGPHAEAEALAQAGRRARGAALVVSLEPCAHTGRTPPCTEAIARAGIRRVVAAMKDPDPRNRGRGLKILRRHGIRTRVGVLEQEARELNRPFVLRMTARRPFVTVKVAQSLDGKIATPSGASRWISGAAARRWAHRLRGESDAVLVGVRTVLRDDPRLTIRRKFRRPLKVVLDSGLQTPPDAQIFRSAGSVLVAATRSASRRREHRLREAGAEVVRLPADPRGGVDFRALLQELARRQVSRLLVEGGGEVIASAFSARAVDRIAWVVAPKILGGREAPGSVGGDGVRSPREAVRLSKVQVRRLGPDLLVTGDVCA